MASCNFGIFPIRISFERQKRAPNCFDAFAFSLPRGTKTPFFLVLPQSKMSDKPLSWCGLPAFTLTFIHHGKAFNLHFSDDLPPTNVLEQYVRSPNFHSHACAVSVAGLSDTYALHPRFLLFGYDAYVRGRESSNPAENCPRIIITVALNHWGISSYHKSIALQLALQWMYNECLQRSERQPDTAITKMTLSTHPHICCHVHSEGKVQTLPVVLPRWISDLMLAWQTGDQVNEDSNVEMGGIKYMKIASLKLS